MTTREDIKKWIEETPGMSRQSLAEALGVTVSCVYNWLSDSKTNNIPSKKLKLIEKMMQESAVPKAAEIGTFRVVGFAVTETQYVEISEAANKSNTSPDRFARDAVLEKVASILNPPA